MTELSDGPVGLAQALIRCASVTPLEAGALDVLERALAQGGFRCHRLVFEEEGTPAVDNLYARIGSGYPHLCFAGHSDVVPPGEAAQWSHPPFAGEIEDGVLYGRGASDMKGAIAAFAAAALDYRQEQRQRPARARSASSSPATRKGRRSTARARCSIGWPPTTSSRITRW